MQKNVPKKVAMCKKKCSLLLIFKFKIRQFIIVSNNFGDPYTKIFVEGGGGTHCCFISASVHSSGSSLRLCACPIEDFDFVAFAAALLQVVLI